MKKIIKVLTIFIVIGVSAGVVYAFVKPAKAFDALLFLAPIADKIRPAGWFTGLKLDFYQFLYRGYIQNFTNIVANKTVYTIVCIIGAVLVVLGTALVTSRGKFTEKVATLGVLCTFFTAIFGLEYVLAVVMLGMALAMFGR